ncbi:acylneuraminate cytidylyltransferase family protein [Muricauda oceani]|uniref:Acylneuraminate cytidylyltransferase family protein n=1 Tax=Flagellimonas oceani TaxID=2698672 RepID=A0A6G7J6D6_9FLAO|nr:acylneuraminate cytidylyltransferase family protein [Allomuricauda oceani]MBW8242639.1 acylneuraminate cytidylyltransferase family protein [Allomuricauda oceani]QII46395.1 acylneuraminate cytidylyltransferase family protein [Allomuricauda oceani]
MNSIVVIPARGGSKGLPGKNIKKLGGKPLIEYTICAAREVFNDEEIVVSTDDLEIKKIVEKTGLKVPFLRPKNLATDVASTQDVLLHIIDFYENQGYSFDVMVLLQPTSPFRTSRHIQEAIDLFYKNQGLDMVVSTKEAKSNPYFSLFEEDANGFLKKSKEGSFTRRQDCPKVWEFNGAIYVINVTALKRNKISEFKNIKKYPMDKKSSLDIDDEFDWLMAEKLVNE